MMWDWLVHYARIALHDGPTETERVGARWFLTFGYNSWSLPRRR